MATVESNLEGLWFVRDLGNCERIDIDSGGGE